MRDAINARGHQSRLEHVVRQSDERLERGNDVVAVFARYGSLSWASAKLAKISSMAAVGKSNRWSRDEAGRWELHRSRCLDISISIVMKLNSQVSFSGVSKALFASHIDHG